MLVARLAPSSATLGGASCPVSATVPARLADHRGREKPPVGPRRALQLARTARLRRSRVFNGGNSAPLFHGLGARALGGRGPRTRLLPRCHGPSPCSGAHFGALAATSAARRAGAPPAGRGDLTERLRLRSEADYTACIVPGLAFRPEIDDAAGAHACGGRGLASPSMRAISSGMLDIKDDVCKTDELHGRVYGVRAREQQRSERGRMHGGKT